MLLFRNSQLYMVMFWDFDYLCSAICILNYEKVFHK